MANKIPQAFIDELMNRTDIVEIIDARVPLRKQGRDYTARCPFHEEKSPSFTVSPTKQFYHCFGCGAHGTALGFLMEYERMGFIDAVQELAARAGMEIPKEAAAHETGDKHAGLYDILEQAATFFRRQLREHAEAAQAVAYLKKRGLSGQIAAAYGIGYAPSGWDHLLKTLGRTPEQQSQLAAAGLIIKKDGGGYYDRFRNRIMFPIRDRRGRTIAFGGRTLGDETPKYLNSPETPVFHKGHELYGLYETRQAVRHLERLLIVEGYMDVVALAQHDIPYAVATLGTATTPEHVEKLFHNTPQIVFCFDGDRAGREAAWRALENTLPAMREGREVRFMFLPEGEDPDTLIRKENNELFLKRIENSVPLSAFFFERLSQKVDISSIDGRARLVELARPWLSKLPAGVFRHMMVSRLAEISRMDRKVLADILNGKTKVPPVPAAHTTRVAPQRKSLGNVDKAIAMLLEKPALASATETEETLEGLELPGVPLLRGLLELLRGQPHLGSAAVMEHWRDTDEGRQLAILAQWQPTVPEAGLEAEFQDTWKWLLDRKKEQQLERQTLQLWNKRPKDLSPEEKAALRQFRPSSIPPQD